MGHHLAVVDAVGEVVWSERIPNDQAAVEKAITMVTAGGARVAWAVDLTSRTSALLPALLTGRRADVNADWVRSVSRLRDLPAGIFPALEREFDFATRAALVLVERYQTPQALRRVGVSRVTAHLHKHGVRRAAEIAERAVAAARTQPVVLPGQDIAARLISEIAGDLLRLWD